MPQAVKSQAVRPQADAEALYEYDWDEAIKNIITEDDEPVDNLFSAKQQRLLARTLYSSWTPLPDGEASPKRTAKRRKFLADVNVGVFYAVSQPPLVPDFFLSLDVQPHKNWFEKQHRTYFVWEFGKVPEVTLEIVSNRKGGELTTKLKDYRQMGVMYYVVYDPNKYLSTDELRVYEIGSGKRYQLRKDLKLPEVGLSLTLWQGEFEDHEDTWLRWCDAQGKLLLTGQEGRAVEASARRRAEAKLRKESLTRKETEAKLRKESQTRKQAEARAEREAERAARLAAKLRELGIDPLGIDLNER